MGRMPSTIGLIFVTLVASLLGGPCRGQDPAPEEVYAWKSIDYNWLAPEDRQIAIDNGNYIPENNALIGVKVWGSYAYVNVARWLPGVPSTLNIVPSFPMEELPLSTPLSPFPSWEMQKEGNCSAIQYIQGMEIDSRGRMWALDVGRRYFFTSNPDNSCPPKLLLLDLDKGGILLHTFVFPEDVVSYDKSFLNDLVVHEGIGTDWYAYITDAKGTSGAIVVYSLSQDKAWRIEDEKSMKAEEGNASEATIGGRMAKLTANIDGIALTPKDEDNPQVFYSPLGSFHLYSIPTSVLQNPPSDPMEIRSSITDWGNRTSQGDGMMMDSFGNLYFGLLGEDGFAKWPAEARTNSTLSEAVVTKDPVRLQWVDGFGFDNAKRELWLVSNRLQNIQAKDVNLKEINYRLFRIHTATKSYQYNRYSS
ncbi:hypothetical protein J437_LFUL012181 [Ladona fulva]|uniref:Bee-milk protein n=1 Tax=Ladona fulva TaxID=123851 RepID=A0A8K0KDH8_LADFU|nr:hypothetical protein J437_LFUL012181 [Ladona fulva]